MEENEKVKEEISLGQIFKLFLSKIKIIIIVVLAAAVVGAGLGVLRTYDKKYYGTKLEFYVNPHRASSVENDSQYGVYGAYGIHVMDNIVKLLSSELFAEQLLLELDEDGQSTQLPAKIDGNDALNNLIDDAKKAKEKYDSYVDNVETYSDLLVTASNNLATNMKNLNSAWAQYKTENPSLSLPDAPTKISLDDPLQLSSLELKINGLIDAVAQNEEDIRVYSAVLEDMKNNAKKAEKTWEEKKNETLEKWRESDPNYSSMLSLYRSSITYTYYSESDKSIDLADSFARSFIYVKVSVLNNEIKAEQIYEKIVNVLPAFVETNMPVPSGYDGTNCQKITRIDGIRLTNEGLVTSTAVKYAVILALAALVLVCITLIIVDRSDKRIKSVDQLPFVFNKPLLGVIPSIKPEFLEKDPEQKTNGAEVNK